MRKMFALFMVFLVSALSILPCTDPHPDEHLFSVFTELFTNPGHAHDVEDHEAEGHKTGEKHEHNEACTPFCTCQCCHTNIAFFDFQLPVLLAVIITENYFSEIITGKPRTASSDVFMPPKSIIG